MKLTVYREGRQTRAGTKARTRVRARASTANRAPGHYTHWKQNWVVS